MIILIALAVIICLLTIKIAFYHRESQQRQIFLELRPPISNDRPLESVKYLYDVLYEILSTKGIKSYFGSRYSLSLEIVSTRAEGIKFVIVVPEQCVKSVKSAFLSHIPDARVKEVDDYLTHEGNIFNRYDNFRQNKHLPSTPQFKSIQQSDKLAYLTGSMKHLKKNELLALQLMIKPVRRRKARLIFKRHLTRYSLSENSATIFKLDQYKAVLNKLSQQLFECNIRTLAISYNEMELNKRRASMAAAIKSLDLTTRLYRTKTTIHIWDQYLFRKRLMNLFGLNSSILSSEELVTLNHFPVYTSSRTENLRWSLSKSLPAPLSLKRNNKIDVLIGINRHHGSNTPIGLTSADRERHLYIIGGTGNGKTTMLLYSIIQDIKAGKGLAVLDPHGDLAETILKHIPEERVKDVIYFNPDDISYPIGMNLLELPEGLTGNELLREKDLVAESTISVLRKLFSEDDSGGHRIEYILRNAIQTALTLDNPTLFTVYDLINDNRFRTTVISELKDKDLKNFWINEFGRAGSFQKIKMSAGITAKIGRFLFSASAKRIMEQPKSTIDFDEVMNGNKILICNFSKGLLGEDTSTLFGTTVLAKLQMASLRRARLAQEEREPFYLYVDEFQNFATMAFVQMLSEARKYKLFLTMAEQSTSQQPYQRLVEVILANVGTIVCFRSGNPADERLILPLFKPFLEEGEIANLASYNFYMRLVSLEAQEPLSGETLLIDGQGSSVIAKRIKKVSRQLYAVDYEDGRMRKNFERQVELKI